MLFLSNFYCFKVLNLSSLSWICQTNYFRTGWRITLNCLCILYLFTEKWLGQSIVVESLFSFHSVLVQDDAIVLSHLGSMVYTGHVIQGFSYKLLNSGSSCHRKARLEILHSSSVPWNGKVHEVSIRATAIAFWLQFRKQACQTPGSSCQIQKWSLFTWTQFLWLICVASSAVMTWTHKNHERWHLAAYFASDLLST